jgi:hypothetical protein
VEVAINIDHATLKTYLMPRRWGTSSILAKIPAKIVYVTIIITKRCVPRFRQRIMATDGKIGH